MTPSDAGGGPPRSIIGRSLAVGGVASGGVVFGIASNWSGFAEESASVMRALWLVPGLVGLHLGQLLLAGMAWRCLFAGSGPGVQDGRGRRPSPHELARRSPTRRSASAWGKKRRRRVPPKNAPIPVTTKVYPPSSSTLIIQVSLLPGRVITR